MAGRSVAEMERRMVAGREYLAALRKLGFQPDIVAWALATPSPEVTRHELLIVTSWVDTIGPLPIYDLLFEAYDNSATPKEIDPFVVSLFSHQTQVAIDLNSAAIVADDARNDPTSRPMMILGMLDYATVPEWILFHRTAKSTRFEDARRFAAFKTNVARLAA